MKETQTIISKLQDAKEVLVHDNAADEKSIQEKQENINTLNAEIEKLKANIEGRNNDIQTLDAKLAESEKLDESLKETSGLLDKIKTTNTEEKEEEKEEVVEEKKEEPKVDFDFGIPKFNEEPKEEAHEEVKEEAKGEPTFNLPNFNDMLNDNENKEEVNFDFKDNMNTYGASEEASVPVFDENGFDISGQSSVDESVNALSNLNEMYNSSDEMMLR